MDHEDSKKERKLELVEIGLDVRIARLLERAVELDEATVGLLGEAVILLKRIERIIAPRTKSIAVRFSSPQGDPATMPNNVLTLNVGQTSTASIQPLLADGTTPSGGTVSNVSYTFSDPSATVALNPDGLTALVTGVAASTAGAVSGSAACTVTDTDGVVSTWTQAFTILVNAVVPPAQLTQSIAVQFTTPQ
jgi:hypothetical protein